MKKLNYYFERTFSRREMLQLLGAVGLGSMAVCACQRRFVRPAAIIDLGPVTKLLDDKTHNRDRAALVMRDEQGWSVLSTRCTYDGCDLTYQPKSLLCVCCRSVFDHRGNVISSPAVDALPWFEIEYKEGNLYANTAKIVPATYRFNTPELQASLAGLLEQHKKERLEEAGKVPDALIPTDDGTVTRMFTEPATLPGDPNSIIPDGYAK